MSIIVVALAVAYLLEVWFETKAFIEYCRQLGVRKWYVGEYLEGICDHLSYPEFLVEHHGEEFWVKLVTCPICLAPWLALGFAILNLVATQHHTSLQSILGSAFLGLTFRRLYRMLMGDADHRS